MISILPAARRAATTKARLLDAAERCFAEQGFAATSMRAITTAAGANLAAANYHFGSKEALFAAVLRRRLDPINHERLAGLDQLERAHPRGALPLETLLEIFLRPPLALARTPSGRSFLRLIARLGHEDVHPCRVLNAQFETVKQRFVAALQRALPRLELLDLFWRAHFMIGAMLHTMTDTHRLKELSGGRCDPADVEGTLAQMVPFCAAGLRGAAPAPTPRATTRAATRAGSRPRARRQAR